MTAGAQMAAVRFRAGDHDVVAEAGQIAALRTVPVPGARAVEELLGLPAADSPGPRCWLLLRDGRRAVEVGGPARLDPLPAAHIHRLPPLLAARLHLRGVVAVALAPATDGAAQLIVDLDRAWELSAR